MLRKFIVLFALLFILGGCGQPADETAVPNQYTVVKEAEIRPGDGVPSPAGEVVLTLTGKIDNPNVGETLQFDMETLEKLGVVEYEVDDKQAEGRTAVFRGVLLEQILAVANVDAEATTLNSIALNDYAVQVPIQDAESFPVMIATAVDGERMTIERYGPVRIIYPYHAYELDETVYDPRWIWQLATLEVQ